MNLLPEQLRRVVVIRGGEGPEGEYDSSAWIVKGLLDLGLEVTVVDVRDAALAEKLRAARPDVLFPVGLGVPAESGHLQGYLHLVLPGVPVVGSGVLPAAVGMNKWVSKLALRGMGIDVADGLLLPPGCAPTFETIKARLGLPFIGKPVLGGASLGFCKIEDADTYNHWLHATWPEFGPLLVEACIQVAEEGVEYAVGVLEGDDGPLALPVCEIRSPGLYDTARKSDRSLATHRLLPQPDPLTARLQDLGVRIFTNWGCKGYLRVDVMQTTEQRLVVLEVNTTPGMIPDVLAFPEMAEAADINYSQLLCLLLKSALTPAPMDLPYQERATWPQLPASLSALLPALSVELLAPQYARHQAPCSSGTRLWRLRGHLRPLLHREIRGDLLPLVGSLQSVFSQVRDQRPTSRRRSPLAGLLTCVVLALLLGGATTVPGVLRWLREQPRSLLEACGIDRIPGTLSTQLRTLDMPAVEAALSGWVQMWGARSTHQPAFRPQPEQFREQEAYLVAG